MVKFSEARITFSEIPTEIALSIGITNCQNHCVGCHSPYMREDIGEILDTARMDSLIEANHGVSCVLFLGEGNDRGTLLDLADYARGKGLKTGIYSGRVTVEKDVFEQHYDYVKIGPYVEKYGPLTSPTTNQRLYKIENGIWVDITKMFWSKI